MFKPGFFFGVVAVFLVLGAPQLANAFSDNIESEAVATLIKNNQLAEAEERLQLNIRKDPKNTTANFNLGVLQFKKNEFEKSIQSFARVLEGESGLRPAAAYYSALCAFMLNKPEKMKLYIETISSDSVFYSLAHELEAAEKGGSDSFFEEAQEAFNSGDNQRCLEALKDSVFSEKPAGTQLKAKCDAGLALEEEEGKVPEDSTKKANRFTNLENDFSVFADLYGGSDSNIFLSPSNPTTKSVYQGEVGAEFLIKNQIDYGAGVEFIYGDVNGVANERYNSLNLFVPVILHFDNSDFSIEGFHEMNDDAAGATYKQTGVNLSYAVDDAEFSFVASSSLSSKKADSSAYNYVNGQYGSLRGDIIYYANEAKLDFFISGYANHSEDLVVTAGTVPYAYDAIEAGAYGSYWITKSIRPALSFSTAQRQYLHQYSRVNRDDTYSVAKLKIEYRNTRNLRFYLEGIFTTNNSTYDSSQIQNRNYSDTLLKLGVLLSN